MGFRCFKFLNMKNIVFDLGAVVVDWNPDKLLQEYPGDRKLPEILFERGFFQTYWSEFDRGVYTQEEMAEKISQCAGHPYEECWDLMEYVKHSLCDIPETVQLIKELSARDYRLFCLSNMSVEYYDYMKHREVVLTERYGLKPEETLFIDDLEANVESARQLGFNILHFSNREKGLRKLREILL